MSSDFEPPGAGEWALDRSHYPGGTTPISEWLISESYGAGFERIFAELGVPAERLDARFVNGFFYTRLRPLISADKPPKRLPPLPVLRVVTRIHPTFRARARQAARTFRERPSNDVAEQWERDIKPRLERENRSFQDVDPAGLGDADLQQHISALLDHLRENFELHFWLHGHDLGPIARYLHASIGWGLDPHEAIEALAGASPSTARPLDRLRRLRQMVEASDREPATLDDVRAISTEASELLDAHLDAHGHVLATGYDITNYTLIELPGVVLHSIRSAGSEAPIDDQARAAALREQLPEDAIHDFDLFLADARAVMDMRDDNGPLTVEWPAGLLRRALLEAGRRLGERGDIVLAAHALELTPHEARMLFTGGLPAPADLARRADRRVESARLDPPPTLGATEPQPPLEVLPEPLAETVAMVQVSLQYMGMDSAPSVDGFAGAGIGTRSYTGRACVASSADEAIDKLEPGEVLVVRATSPAFNAVLSIAGAVITADGGALSHAAVIARELGIPAVVGASAALSIPDGSTVEVDPTAGVIRVLS